jgi:hypothetical protein
MQSRYRFGFKRYVIVTALALTAGYAHACDCTKPENYGNPACRSIITDALKDKPIATSASTSGANAASNAAATAGAAANATTGPVTATGGAGGAGGNATGGSVGNVTASGGTQAQKQGQAQQATADASNAGNAQSTTIETNYRAARIPVNTAYAAGLVAGLCGIGSTSGGVQTPLIGATFGTTRQNKPLRAVCTAYLISPLIGCVTAYQQLPEIKSAFESIGLTCEAIYSPPVEYRVPEGYLSPEDVEARVAAAVKAMTPPPCPAPPVSTNKRKGKRKAALANSPGCAMPQGYFGSNSLGVNPPR